LKLRSPTSFKDKTPRDRPAGCLYFAIRSRRSHAPGPGGTQRGPILHPAHWGPKYYLPV